MSPALLRVATVSLAYLSTALALSLDPTTQRYLQEMGRLLSEPQHHFNVAAPTETELNGASGEVLNGAAPGMYEDYGAARGQGRFATPHRPSEPMYPHQREASNGYHSPYPSQTAGASSPPLNGARQYPPVANSQILNGARQNGYHSPHPSQMTGARTQMVNGSPQYAPAAHSQTLNGASESPLNKLEQNMEWDQDVQNNHFPSDSEQPSSRLDVVEANSGVPHFSAANQQSWEQGVQTPGMGQGGWQEGATEEASTHAEWERHEVEFQRLEQEYLASVQAASMPNGEAAEDAAASASRPWRPSLPTKSRHSPQLPLTNNPFELLGLDHDHVPRNAEDLRRAYLKMVRKYHPDAVAADATQEEREQASLNFARINTAYEALKKKRERLGDNYFATMMGGPMHYSRRSRWGHHGHAGGYNDDDDYDYDYGSIFAARGGRGASGTRRGGRHPGGRYTRRNRHEGGESCHVSGWDFPPFFNR